MRMHGAVAVAIAALFAIPATGTSQEEAAQTFAAKCAMCHGQGGAGDGMAAAAMDPKPTDFTDASFQEDRTDEQIAELIAAGKGAMPAYAEQLSAEAIEALVAYIRELGKQ